MGGGRDGRKEGREGRGKGREGEGRGGTCSKVLGRIDAPASGYLRTINFFANRNLHLQSDARVLRFTRYEQ